MKKTSLFLIIYILGASVIKAASDSEYEEASLTYYLVRVGFTCSEKQGFVKDFFSRSNGKKEVHFIWVPSNVTLADVKAALTRKKNQLHKAHIAGKDEKKSKEKKPECKITFKKFEVHKQRFTEVIQSMDDTLFHEIDLDEKEKPLSKQQPKNNVPFAIYKEEDFPPFLKEAAQYLKKTEDVEERLKKATEKSLEKNYLFLFNSIKEGCIFMHKVKGRGEHQDSWALSDFSRSDYESETETNTEEATLVDDEDEEDEKQVEPAASFSPLQTQDTYYERLKTSSRQKTPYPALSTKVQPNISWPSSTSTSDSRSRAPTPYPTDLAPLGSAFPSKRSEQTSSSMSEVAPQETNQIPISKPPEVDRTQEETSGDLKPSPEGARDIMIEALENQQKKQEKKSSPRESTMVSDQLLTTGLFATLASGLYFYVQKLRGPKENPDNEEEKESDEDIFI